ncbi:50S ribosomal protein L32 [Candidatus Curtissbacteria bacterium RBG_16_39_7]|uniref:Large ribosomal subunit protein bL32 n=1 Tax=Candidatus Curtissbacteria bacterium RBG_16_39_7 TaxID=1797707 RepID=A0A1F5G2Y8_9BACT|nr:MAG: 50S ribosomal protein L32 [Candidatus Curtissbacteria bacterium RBG_16_39_7]
MAPQPKKKHSKSRTGKRRWAKKFALPGFSICPNCKKEKLPHAVCPHCGYYKGQKQEGVI